MARPAKLQEPEGEKRTMAEEPKVRVMSASVKTAPGSTTGDITVAELNALIDMEFYSKGYVLHSTNAYYGDSESFRAYFVFVKP
jgi:hypothetical protein